MRVSCIGVLVLVLAAPPSRAQVPASRDTAYWSAIIQKNYAVPDGQSPLALIQEMNALLASPDPFLRDDVAYGIAQRWIYRERKLSPADLQIVLDLWQQNLTAGLGETGTDAVLRRSFSALNLSLLAALDNESPFLDQPGFERFFEAALDYFVRERDLRGFDARVGWMHSVAHTADLLKFLARSPRLPPSAQGRLLDAIARKIGDAGFVFVWGEDERLAAVLRSIVRRGDFERAAFDAWIARFPEQHKALWAKGPAIDPARFPPVQNAKHLLRSLLSVLSMDPKPSENVLAVRTRLVEVLGKML